MKKATFAGGFFHIEDRSLQNIAIDQVLQVFLTA